MSDSGVLKSKEFNLQKLLDEIFLVLTEKEQIIVTRRFSLDNQPKVTLERIGEDFSVTRERIRQIESIAIGKLKRTVPSTKLYLINKLAKQILEVSGGVVLESTLVASVLNNIHASSPVDGAIIKLSLSVDSDLVKIDRTGDLKPFWRFAAFPMERVRKIADASYKVLKKKGKVTDDHVIAADVQKLNLFKDTKPKAETVMSILSLDSRLKKTEDGWGLMEWRSINPKSIRDKAEIVLKNKKQPLHFVEIANEISKLNVNKKVVTVQAVHNELIRYDQFVLVGKGLYALAEWGYEPGTVADVITSILKEDGPLSKKEIVEKVKKQRDVKIGTISLNLQKYPQFVRVGRAVYDFDEKSIA